MSKNGHACAYCGLVFQRITDHMSHVIAEHDRGRRTHNARLARPVSCWSCGVVDMLPRSSDMRYECPKCGFVLPDNWINGQLAPEGGFQETKEDSIELSSDERTPS